jgi:uncharacterized protein YyaL (SSP411 family)
MAEPRYTNRLLEETSPYLRQHAHNPVAWQPWGLEALAQARREEKPILLSIGYSACHWCHVMAHESFEDEATAQVMNERSSTSRWIVRSGLTSTKFIKPPFRCCTGDRAAGR